MENFIQQTKQNYQTITEQVEIAKQQFRERTETVKIVVVSKRKSVETIQAAIDSGILDFGENYPDEAVSKIQALEGQSAVWHMIGHIQSRKAELVAEYFNLVHSIDSLRIAEKLSQRCQLNHRSLPLLLECNMSGEESKFGFAANEKKFWPEFMEQVGQISALPSIELIGLMTMPPWNDDPEASRPYFSRLRELKEYINSQLPDLHLRELSMGTSIDYLAGVKEGATILRIGTAILGSR